MSLSKSGGQRWSSSKDGTRDWKRLTEQRGGKKNNLEKAIRERIRKKSSFTEVTIGLKCSPNTYLLESILSLQKGGFKNQPQDFCWFRNFCLQLLQNDRNFRSQTDASWKTRFSNLNLTKSGAWLEPSEGLLVPITWFTRWWTATSCRRLMCQCGRK